MSTLTPDMIAALQAHRDEYVKNNSNRCRTERGAEKSWRDHLTQAWLNDWREQWGILRTVRNQIGIQEAFTQFAEIRKNK